MSVPGAALTLAALPPLCLLLWPQPISPSYPAMGIGAGTTIRRAILDKNVRIGKDVQVRKG